MHLSWTLMGSIRPNIFLFLWTRPGKIQMRSEEHTSELQSQSNLVRRLLLEKKKPPSLSHCPAQLTAADPRLPRAPTHSHPPSAILLHRSLRRPDRLSNCASR